MSRAVVACAVGLVVAGACNERRPAIPEDAAPRRAPAPAPPAPQPSTTTFVVRVTDAGEPVAARVLLVDAKGAPLHMGTLDVYGARQGAGACAFAVDVIGSWDGLILGHGAAEIPVGADHCRPSPAIPYGRYKVVAWRGIEYERWEGEVDLSAKRGRVELAIPLERAWTPTGTLAADLHVHAHESNDSNMPNAQRVVAEAASGIQVIAPANHNANADVGDDITAVGLGGTIASIASNELSNDALHVGVYPVVIDRAKPRNGAIPEADVVARAGSNAVAEAKRLFGLARALPGRPIVQLNHPRLRYAALFDSAGWDGRAWPPPFPLEFDAVEVLNGFTAFNVEGDRRIDASVRDYLTLVDHGVLVAPVGNSDTHDFNWVVDGTARTYVYADPPALPLDTGAFVQAIRARRTVATTGPWLEVRASASPTASRAVGPGQVLRARTRVWLDVTVAQARFVKTARLRVWLGTPRGPELVRELEVPAGVRRHPWSGWISVGRADTWLVVTADGDAPLPLDQTGSYQHDKWKHAGVTPFAIAAPILVDANRDGRWRRKGRSLRVK
jgi:hypothetical protein